MEEVTKKMSSLSSLGISYYTCVKRPRLCPSRVEILQEIPREEVEEEQQVVQENQLEILQEIPREQYEEEQQAVQGNQLDLPQDREEFLPLTADQLATVQQALSGEPDLDQNEVLVTIARLEIKRCDIIQLEGSKWLNSVLIDCYLALIKGRSEAVSSLPNIHVMSCGFMIKLKLEGYGAVRRWTKKINLFDLDLLIVPIHAPFHWRLIIVDFKERAITRYESLGDTSVSDAHILENYLKDEAVDKLRTKLNTDEWSIGCSTNCPQQANLDDCGVFVCTIAEYVSRRAALTFNQSNMPYLRHKMV
jgi:sentrin-specific protease 1